MVGSSAQGTQHCFTEFLLCLRCVCGENMNVSEDLGRPGHTVNIWMYCPHPLIPFSGKASKLKRSQTYRQISGKKHNHHHHNVSDSILPLTRVYSTIPQVLFYIKGKHGKDLKARIRTVFWGFLCLNLRLASPRLLRGGKGLTILSLMTAFSSVLLYPLSTYCEPSTVGRKFKGIQDR